MKDPRFFLCLALSLLHFTPSSFAFLAGDGNADANLSSVDFPYFTHHSILEIALKQVDPNESFYNETVRKWIYRGNFVRDLSQFLKIGAHEGDDELSNTDKLKLKIANFMVEQQLDLDDDDESTKVTADELATYKSYEHMDSPVWIEEDGRVSGFVAPEQIEIDERTAMINFIANRQGSWNTSSQYVEEQLRLSWAGYRAAIAITDSEAQEKALVNAFMFLGFAGHVIEDQFSHSNFVELAIMRSIIIRDYQGNATREQMDALYETIFPWVGQQTVLQCGSTLCYPLVTGRGSHGFKDTAFNVLAIVETRLRRHFEKRSLRFMSRKHLQILHKRGVSNPTLKSGLNEVLDILQDESQEIAMSRGQHVFTEPESVLPTHSQLNKDHNSHPLHVLSAQCAIDVQVAVGKAFRDSVTSDSNADRVVQTALALEINPFYVTSSAPDGIRECLERVDAFVADPKNAKRLQLLNLANSRTGENKLNEDNK